MVVIKPPGAGGDAGTEVAYSCATIIQKGDLVYISGNDTVDKADNTNLLTVPCIGMVDRKQSPTICIVKNAGEISGLSGIIPGQKYFVGTNGDITTTPPSADGTIVQIIGVGVKSDTILMTLSYNFVQNKL